MATAEYMLDTNICSFLMRDQASVWANLLSAVAQGADIVISAIVYSELLDGVNGPKASPKVATLLEALLLRLDGVASWDRAAADKTAAIRRTLRLSGTPIGLSDSAIAGHAVSRDAILVTNNTREFGRVKGLTLEDWTQLA